MPTIYERIDAGRFQVQLADGKLWWRVGAMRNHRNAIAVRQYADPELPSFGPGDMRTIPEEFLAHARATYSIACRRLTDSDAAIAKLELPEGGASRANRHPGFEVLIPLRGEMRLRIGNTSTSFSAEDNLFVHFKSNREHQLFNDGKEVAEALVLRIYL